MIRDRDVLRVVLSCDFFLKYTASLARGLADVGCSVMLVSRDHGFEFGGDSEAMADYVDAVLDGHVVHEPLPGRVREVRGWRDMARIRSRVASFRPDVMHVQDSVANDPRLIRVARPGHPPLAVTVHDPVTRLEDRETRMGMIAYRWLLRRAGVVFVHADTLREQLIEAESVDAPVVVVPHGVANPSIARLPETASLLFFGRMSPYKGLDVLLDAMPIVWREAPEVTLTVAGAGPLPDHSVLADARLRVRNEHIPEQDVTRLFADSTCLVLPYRSASQSGVGSLAKQHGRAVIATRTGGLPELVVPGTGRLVAPESPGALAAAIVETAVDRAKAEEMGRTAAATVVESFGWDRVASLTLGAYERHLLR